MDKYIRQIFSLFALLMLVVFVVRIQAGLWSDVNWGMLAIAGILCLLVFRVFIYIFNFSYSLVCIANAVWIAWMLPSTVSFLLAAVMAAFGLRLLLFSAGRTRSESYAPRITRVRNEDARLPVFVKGALWLQCSFLYVFHQYGIYLAARGAELSAGVLAGALLMAVGIWLEWRADSQKQAAKAVAPGDFVSTGIFARWRHPNYAGEMLVQLGLIVVGLTVAGAHWSDYLAVVLAPFYIILLMLSECQRVDRSMDERYGDRPAWREYRARSGSALPRLQG